MMLENYNITFAQNEKLPYRRGEDVLHSKKIHPDAFLDYIQPGSGDKKMQDIRLDLNLIWQVYEDEIDDPENFSVLVFW